MYSPYVVVCNVVKMLQAATATGNYFDDDFYLFSDVGPARPVKVLGNSRWNCFNKTIIS